MKFTFAAACLLGVTLADQEYALADDRGLDNNNVIPADKSEDENGFKLDWNVGGGQGVFVDPEDGEGWEIQVLEPAPCNLEEAGRGLEEEVAAVLWSVCSCTLCVKYTVFLCQSRCIVFLTHTKP